MYVERARFITPMWLWMLSGCAPSAVEESGTVQAPTLVLGQGVVAFAPLDQNQMEIVFGPQGGWHVEPAVRGWGLDVEGLVLGYDLVDQAGVSWVYPVETLLGGGRVLPLEDGGWERVGDRLVLDINSADDANGGQFNLLLRATPTDGDSFSLDTLVTLVDEAP